MAAGRYLPGAAGNSCPGDRTRIKLGLTGTWLVRLPGGRRNNAHSVNQAVAA